MGVREKILAIRLAEKAKANPAAAEKLGIIVIPNRKKKGEEHGTNQRT